MCTSFVTESDASLKVLVTVRDVVVPEMLLATPPPLMDTVVAPPVTDSVMVQFDP